MKNILSYIGFNQVTNTRLSRLDSLSIVSRQSVVVVLAVFLTMFSGTAWGTEYKYTEFATSFKKGTSSSGTSISTEFTTSTNVSTIVASGAGNWASKVTARSNSYYSTSGIGIRISKSSGAGYFTLTLSDALKDSTIYAIVIHASKVSGNKSSVLNITPTAPSGGYTTVTNIANGTLKAYSASYDPLNNYYKLDTIYVGGKKINTLKFGSASGGYTHLHRVSIITQTEKVASTCVLHHGSGGSTPTNMTQGSGTLPSGNAVAGWTFSHWSTSQQTTPSASPSGTSYNSGVTTPAQANLYAFYINDCNSLYCTAPTAVYHIVNMGPAVSGGDDDDYFYTTVGGNDNVFCNITSGTTVYLTGHIGTGHSFHEWHVTKTDDASTVVTVTNPTAYDGTAYFTMPSYNVDIDAEFCRSLNGEDVTVAQETTKTSTEIEWECEDAKYYEVAIKNPEGAYIYRQNDWVTALGTGITIDTLRPATTYRLQISAINACQETKSSKRSNTYDEYFTTPGHTVTYSQAGEDVTTSVPVDASSGTYGNSASVTLLDKNSDSHKADCYFAGWTDNSSGTGTIYKPGDTYTISSDVTFYAKWVACSVATTPSSLSVSGSGTPNVTFSWDAVDGATKYELVLMDENSTLYEFETTSTSKTINISEVGDEGEYMGQVRACNGTIGYCYEDFSDDIEFAEGCPNYSFHFGTDKGSDWNDPADYCFVKSTSDGNGGYFYLLEDFTMPEKPDFYLGWQGSFDGTNAKSKTLGFGSIPFDLQRGKTIGTYSSGNTQGAVGILRIRSSYGDDNRYIGFIPGGYVLRLGTDGTGWTSYAFTAASANYYETVWTTDIMTLTAGILGGNAYVGLKTSDSFVWNSTYSQSNAINGNMGQKSGTSTWGSNLSSTNDVGKRGKFRIWADNTAKNWNLHFVPYHRIIYHANYPVGVSPADTYSVDVSVEETNSSISLNSAPSAPTGYTFDGWYDAATGGTKKTGSQTISAGASADSEYYAHWTINTHSVNYSAPSNGDYTISVAGGTATSATKNADYGQTVTLAATGNTGYEFTSWDVYKTGESGTKVSVTNNQFTMPDYDVTVTATFTAIDYNVTYSAPSNGNYTIKVASGTASSATKTANYGQTITLAATPSGGYDFSSWTITNTSTSADVTSSVSLSSSSTSPATFTMPAYGVTVTAAFGVQTYTITYKDQGGGDFTGTQTDPPTTHTYGTATTLKIPTKTGYTFGGWFTTSGCTAGSEVGTSSAASLGATAFTADITLYAKWSVNSYNVAVADVDHVAITATPASELAIGEGSNRDVNYGKSVTLAYSSLESKNYWGGWVVTNAGGDDVTASVVVGNTLTVPAYAVTVSAMTYGELVAWCDPQIEVSDGFCLTSYYIDAAASTTNTVYTTSAAGNLLTINSTDLGGVDRVEFIYLDGSDNPVALTSSPFRMCNDGSENYNIADPKTTATSWTKSGLSNTCALSYSLSYKPTNYNLMDNYKLKMVFKKGASDVRKTIIREMNGRSLPKEFVIAVKGGDQWYALPNTLKGTQGEQGSIVPVKITVDNPSGTPTQATYAPDIAIYKGRAKYAAANPSSMALTSNGSNYLQTSSVSDVYQMWLSSSGDADDVDWYFKSSDRSVYELTMDPVNSPSKKMAFYNATYMGYYGGGAGTASYDIYLLPVKNKYTDIPATASEWGQYSVILAANPGATATKAQARIEAGTPTADQTITAINAAMGTAKNVKVPVGSINLADLTNNEGKLLYIDWFAGSTPLGTSCVTIPRIIAASRNMKTDAETAKNAWTDKEVHVLPGATLTANTNDYATGSGSATIKELHIYPGATLNVSTGTLTATTLRLHNGWTRAGDRQYNTARVYIADDAALTKTTASMDYDIYEQSDGKHYYPLAVPFETAVSGIDYADSYLAGFSTYGTHYAIKTYNGERRAEYGEDQANNWSIVASDATLSPGKGYIMTAVAVKGEAIIRIPLVYNDAWTADGELGTATYDEASHTKNVVAVTAYTGSAASSNDRHKGWNMLGVPYMSCFATKDGATHSKDEGFITGKMVLTGDPSDPYGGYDDGVVYVTVPTHDFSEYIQTAITDGDTKLLPGWSFLIQAAKDGNVTFLDSKRTQNSDLPIYAPKREDSPVVKTGIILSNGERSDKTTLLISDKYSAEYEIGADLEKMFGSAFTLSTYSIMNNTKLAYNALSNAEAQQIIPIGVRIPAEGEYTFSLNPRYAEANIERLDLIDYQTGEITNLMTTDYTFSMTQGENTERFALNVTTRKDTPTDTEQVDVGDERTRKLIINDKLYIFRNGRIYDATGKQVKGGAQ